MNIIRCDICQMVSPKSWSLKLRREGVGEVLIHQSEVEPVDLHLCRTCLEKRLGLRVETRGSLVGGSYDIAFVQPAKEAQAV